MIALLFAFLAVAQAEFEVVSIKPGDPGDPASSARSTRGGLEMKNTTLNNLVRGAYNLNEFQLAGGPKWADTAKFDIVAKLPAGAAREQTQQMLQAMLAERFKLVFHRETRTIPEYALVVGKDGPKLRASSEEEKKQSRTSQGPRMIKATGTTVEALARMLISAVGAPVLNRTGLEGEYNFDLRFAPLMGGTEETLPDIFGAVQQQLGLKLEPIKGPVEVLIVDKAEMPTPN